jgi:ferredoxin
MANTAPNIGSQICISKDYLQPIFEALRKRNYRLIGPTLGEGAIVLDEIQETWDLPMGWTDQQQPGTYRLAQREDRSLFGYVVGPHSWKRYLYPPVQELLEVERRKDGISAQPIPQDVTRYAFIGVRPCDLSAIAIQDRVFMGGPHQDPHYRARRREVFILAVNCTRPGGTCFCVSLHTGPKAAAGFDLSLTELEDVLLVEIGSEMGKEAISAVSWRPAGAFELQAARQLLAEAENHMGRKLDTHHLPDLLYQNLEHRRWDLLDKRCLSCGNCTQVCPTCFCSDMVEISDLRGQKAKRVRLWDSCFSLHFSHVHGGNIRPSIRSRYRQWLTHKLAFWFDQFGQIGCVGCGRCITWCPVGIDLTEETRAIQMEGTK